MSSGRRAPLRTATTFPPATYSPPAAEVVEEHTYKGYRIEPASYGVNTATWSPRVVVSVRTEDRWSRLAPLYATATARFSSREAADRSAVDVARLWIDSAVERQREDGAATSRGWRA